jgi:membrane protease YdiL (CAAX protease family)
VVWVLFGEFAWGDRTKWPSWLTDLPQVDVPLQLAFAVVVAAVLIYVRAIRRAPLATLGLNLREIGPDVRWLLRALPGLALGYLALGGLAVLGVYIVADHPPETIKNTLRASFFQDTGLANLFRVLIAAPVLEEIWYRGMLYTPLRRERGRWVAIIFTTLYFGFSHGPFPVTQLLGGLIFAWAYECRRTLVAPMVLHFCGNGTLVLGGILVHKWNLLG